MDYVIFERSLTLTRCVHEELYPKVSVFIYLFVAGHGITLPVA
jgi:hypothetical protein